LARYNAAYGRNYLGAKEGQSNLTLEAGRDLAYWANGLVLARTLDGVFIDVQQGALDAQFVAGVTPVRTVDFDTTRPGFDYNTRRGFFGTMVNLQVGDHRPYIYGLLQRDYNTLNETDLDAGISDTRFQYNSFYLGAGSTGALTDHLHYGLEVAYEGGRTFSNSFRVTEFGIIPDDQTRNEIMAMALDGRLDYLMNDPHDTRLSFEIIAASGDSDRGITNTTFNGNAIGTNDHAFNGFGILNTGLALAPDVSNILAFRFGAATFPAPQIAAFRRLQIGTDFFILNKLRSDAPIDEPTNAGERFLGVEPDVYLNWEMTSDLTLALRYGIFFPNDRAFGNDEVRQFFFAGLTFSF
ncbi:MAG TPA: alginate export family protein, partial [Alphaproteobacteria bacterium]|nr:alginate export family protein [Alphaproteobacteria bacterium]